MKVKTYECTVEDGQIRLPESVRLPEHSKVYDIVPDVSLDSRVRAGSPRLAQPERAVDFRMKVIEEAQDAGL